MYKMTCLMCGIDFNIPSYDNGKCDICGTEYEYIEDHTIVLTDKQIGILREQHNQKRKNDGKENGIKISESEK